MTESVENRLARLSSATEDVRPDGGLARAVLARIEADEGALGVWLWRTGRWAVAAFAAASIACVLWYRQAEVSTDQVVMASLDPTELDP